jgi:hypothetical protein
VLQAGEEISSDAFNARPNLSIGREQLGGQDFDCADHLLQRLIPTPMVTLRRASNNRNKGFGYAQS